MRNPKSNRTVTRPPARGKKKADDLSVRARLLQSALHLFAAHGYDGVAVDEIVDRAGANKRMVYHYFGSKEGIYGEVLRTAFDQVEAVEVSLFHRDGTVGDPVQALEQTVATFFAYLQNHNDFVRLLLWENLNEGRHLKKLLRPVSKSPTLRHLSQILDEGERAGLFRSGLDPRSVFVGLLGLCLIYFSNRHTLSLTLGVDISAKAFLRRAAQHSCDILLHGIARSEKK